MKSIKQHQLYRGGVWADDVTPCQTSNVTRRVARGLENKKEYFKSNLKKEKRKIFTFYFFDTPRFSLP